MNRNFAYFSNVIQLRIWAYLYYFLDCIFPWTKLKQQKEHIKNFADNQHKNHAFNVVSDPYYYTYGFFERPEDFSATMVKNTDGLVINPITTTTNQEKPGILFPAYYGLVSYNYFVKSNDTVALQNIRAHADFITPYIQSDGSIIIRQDFDLFKQRAPWYSGITQGIVASFMMRAHLLFPEAGFDKKIQAILDFMLDSSAPKPMMVTSRDNGPWIEEYPMQHPSMVLNGFIFSIISLFEYGSMFDNKRYTEKGEEMLRSLVKSLYRFLYPVGIKHNVFQVKFGNINYQALHTFQLYHLYKVTGNTFFLGLSRKYYTKTDWSLFCSFYNIPLDKNRFNMDKLS